MIIEHIESNVGGGADGLADTEANVPGWLLVLNGLSLTNLVPRIECGVDVDLNVRLDITLEQATIIGDFGLLDSDGKWSLTVIGTYWVHRRWIDRAA